VVEQALRKRTQSKYYRFTVRYTDNAAVDTATLGAGDIRIKGPDGYTRLARLVSVDQSSNGQTRVATYEVKGKDGHWTRGRNGLYTIWVMNKQVRDTAGNPVRGHQIGAFTVRIPEGVSALPPAAPTFATTRVTKALLD
jgi:hypothetical protein